MNARLTLGEKLKDLRVAKKLKLADVEEATGISSLQNIKVVLTSCTAIILLLAIKRIHVLCIYMDMFNYSYLYDICFRFLSLTIKNLLHIRDCLGSPYDDDFQSLVLKPHIN